MAKATTAIIPYGNETYEVTATEYVLWEDRLEQAGVQAGDIEGYEWITYDLLWEQGYFPKRPDVPKPQYLVDGVKAPQVPEKEFPIYDPLLTQEEREHKERFERQYRNYEIERYNRLFNNPNQPKVFVSKVNPKFYNDRGEELTILDWVKFIVVLGVLLIFFLAVAKTMF